jgi:hypothetical protein
MSKCQAAKAGAIDPSMWTCVAGVSGSDPTTGAVRLEMVGNGATGGVWNYCISATSEGDQCKARPSYTTAVAGNLTLCNAGCSYAPDTGVEKWTVRGVSGHSTPGGGGRMVPTGQTCGSGPNTALDPPPVSQPVPKLCGGGSCVDTSSGQACALNGAGEQVCVKLPPKGADGSCASKGDTTLCAGNPAPKPPNPPITDPATQITGSDQYGSQSGNGPINNNTVNNYNNTGNNPNPGKGAGDTDGSDQKPDDQKKDDGTSASGGGDCSTAPMVEGSAALAMIARQAWLLRCADSGQGADDSDKSVPGLDDVGDKPGDGFKTEISVMDKLDFGGFGGGGQCPRLPEFDIGSWGHYSLNSDWWCELLNKISFLIVALGVWAALTILGEK